MVLPIGFTSWRDYFDFTLAREFVDIKGNALSYQPNRLESFGQLISRPIIEPLSFFAKNIKNPLMILALATIAIASATIIFYPAHFMLIVTNVVPFTLNIEPWMIKFAVYITMVSTILGLGARALGRISHQELFIKWQNKEIQAVHLGDIRIEGLNLNAKLE